MSSQQVGLLVIGVGVVLVLVGLLAWAGGLSWFGHLPGDLRIEREGVRIYLPITSMLLISVVLSALLWLLQRLF